MPKRIMNMMLICLILISIVTVRGQFVERTNIQRDSDNQSVSLSEQEIAEEVNKRFKSSFLENQGQLGNEEIIFYGSLPNGRIAFGESKVMLWMEGMESIITLNFIGARKISPIGVEELITRSNYFLGNRGTYTNVRSFEAILYNDLWKGIDLYYQATPKGAKYEFRLAPEANPEDISISSEGQEQLSIRKDSLILLKGEGRFIDEGLKVLQEGEEIAARFVTKGDNIFGFQLSEYDRTKSLLIDPLLYSTFVGGSVFDDGYSITLDSEGNAYVTGRTFSYDFPTTENTYNRTYGGNLDCFVFKLAADGSSLLYSTFVGGSSGDYGSSIAFDSEGNAYVTGSTKSIGFPTTTNAYSRTLSGSTNCFVFKLLIEEATNGIGLPTIRIISLTFASLTIIASITIIIPQRRKRK
ncbi:MAG: SBBP repeat-containing protein [Candidatus Heimdallarchaeota archaeon]